MSDYTTYTNYAKKAIDELQQLANFKKSLKGKKLADKIHRFKNKEFMYLERQLAPASADDVLDLRIAGVYGQQEYQRFYPAGEVTAHLLGFTNVDDQGQEGVELAYDEWLSGTSGRKQVLKDLALTLR